MHKIRIIASAWTDVLSTFVSKTSSELLVMSPWITNTAARLISRSLEQVGPVKVQILSRLDQSDFLSGSSHIEAFKNDNYPSTAHVEFRALPMLHAKMLVADRKRIIIGSANMTESGLMRNHEISIYLESETTGEQCADVFFKFWSMASAIPDDYMKQVEELIEQMLPDSKGQYNTVLKPNPLRQKKRLARFKYIRPDGVEEAQRCLEALFRLPLQDEDDFESEDSANIWLNRQLKFIPETQRRSQIVIRRVEKLMYHKNTSVRATAIDRAGRSGNRIYIPRLLSLVTNPTETTEIRSASAFALGLLGAPESFAVLSQLADGEKDLNRWARRSCFLMLDSVDHENSAWFLHEIKVENPILTIELARLYQIGTGSVAERLTKGLLLEKIATSSWGTPEINALVYIMKSVAYELSKTKKYHQLLDIIRFSSKALGISPGDLRHGPLSPTLLHQINKHGVTDPGLIIAIGTILTEVERENSSVVKAVTSDSRFEKVIEIFQTKEYNQLKRINNNSST